MIKLRKLKIALFVISAAVSLLSLRDKATVVTVPNINPPVAEAYHAPVWSQPQSVFAEESTKPSGIVRNLSQELTGSTSAEFVESDMPHHGKTCYVFLSQSGETKDLHRCLEMIGTSAIKIGVINVVDSLIAREVDCGVYLNCGRENAVASTKAFTSQVVVLTMIATWFKQSDHKQSDHKQSDNKQSPQVHPSRLGDPQVHQSRLGDPHIPKIRRLHNDIIKTIEDATESCKLVAKALVSSSSIFILGKENYVSVAKEGSLKMKEIGYIHAEGYSSAALKHGPYALLTPGFPVILLSPDDESFVRNQGVFDELKSRGALVIGVSDCELSDAYDYRIRVPTGGYTELLTNVVLQLIAYYLSVEKGINPDYPRNIAKVLSTD